MFGYLQFEIPSDVVRLDPGCDTAGDWRECVYPADAPDYYLCLVGLGPNSQLLLRLCPGCPWVSAQDCDNSEEKEILMASNKRRLSRTHKLWIVDVTLFAVFLLVMNVPLTDIAIHEWLGIAIGVGLVVHLVQHGNWLATISQRFRSATSFRNRLNYVMTGLLFVAFVSIIVSGLVISEAAMPWLGIVTAQSTFWLWLHLVSVNVVLLLTAFHLALNWQWIVANFTRFVLDPIRSRVGQRRTEPAYPTTEVS